MKLKGKNKLLMSSSLFCGYLYNSLVDNWSIQCKKDKEGVGQI